MKAMKLSKRFFFSFSKDFLETGGVFRPFVRKIICLKKRSLEKESYSLLKSKL